MQALLKASLTVAFESCDELEEMGEKSSNGSPPSDGRFREHALSSAAAIPHIGDVRWEESPCASANRNRCIMESFGTTALEPNADVLINVPLVMALLNTTPPRQAQCH